MSAVFNFQSLLVVILLIICTCAYVRSMYPSILDRNKAGFLGLFWKAARIGESSKPSASYPFSSKSSNSQTSEFD